MRLAWVGLYALAMAYVESAAVVYLRRLFGVADLMHDRPPYDPQIASVELGRELATLAMLFAVGSVAGRSRQARLGCFLFAFGLWDIFYYAWLRALLGWPGSLLTQDLLFLFPLPWWGPVVAPVLISGLMIAGGALLVLRDEQGRRVRLRPGEWTVMTAGTLLILYSFMVDALAALPADPEALSRLRPSPFKWPVFLLGLAGLGWPVWRAAGAHGRP